VGNKHFEDLRCPKCLKPFETRHGLRAHQGAKRHTVDAIHRPEETAARIQLRREHKRRVKLEKRNEKS
jgi:hypothetical protein